MATAAKSLPPHPVSRIECFTDGSCLVNPNGPGGYAAIVCLHYPENNAEAVPPTVRTLTLGGGMQSTTNNRMELQGAILALETAHAHRTDSTRCTVSTDSQYVKNGITDWVHKWKKNGWTTAGRAPVKNVDLWKKLDALAAQFPAGRLQWAWVKGHAGHPLNEQADAHAGEQALRYATHDVLMGMSIQARRGTTNNKKKKAAAGGSIGAIAQRAGKFSSLKITK